MTRSKQSKEDYEIDLSKTKKIVKRTVPENQISIKKISNQKEIVAQFPLIRNQQSKMVMSIPVYRKDNLDFTPGFCLSDEFTTEYRNEQKVLQEYRIATETSMIDATKLQLPKPSSRNSYCTICKIRFEDYKEHISLEGHLSKMRSSPFGKHIQQMIEKKSIERFLNSNYNKDEKETKIEDQKSCLIFDQGVERFQRTISADSKESLYQKISQEIVKFKVVSTQPQNEFVENEIFDVLNYM